MYNEQVLGDFEKTTFHFIKNENNCNLFNASEIGRFLKIDISEFMKSEGFDRWMKVSLNSDDPLKIGKLEFDDLVIIQDEKIYLHKFLIYELIKNQRTDFYFWYDQLFYKQMKEFAREQVFNENKYNNI